MISATHTTGDIERFAELKKLSLRRLRELHIENVEGGIRFPCFDARGKLTATARIREFTETAHPTKWVGPPMVYGQQALRRARAIGELVAVEGESDQLTLREHSTPAIGIPGSTMTKHITSDIVNEIDRIFAVYEPDDGGSTFIAGIEKRLREIGWVGELCIVDLQATCGVKDPSDLHTRDPDGFEQAWKTAVAIAHTIHIVTEPSKYIEPPKNSDGVMSFDDLVKRSTEQVDWAIDGMLRKTGLMLMTSLPKVGKSDSARNLAKATATGGLFLGRRCQKGKVLWIGLEEPVSHLQDRIEVMGMAGLDVSDISYVVARPEGDESAWLRAVVENHRPALVIIDTIGRFANIEDINSYSDVTRATQPMLDIRAKHNVTFVLLHHNNKLDKTLGSVQWDGSVDTILSITRNPDGGRFAKTKQRAGIDMEATVLKMDPNTGEITCDKSAYMADKEVAEQNILRYLAKVENTGREDLANHCGRKTYIGRAAVDSLVSAGLIRSKGTGTKADPRLYYPVSSSTDSSSDPTFVYAEESGEPVGRAQKSPGAVRGIPDNPANPENPENPDGTGGIYI